MLTSSICDFQMVRYGRKVHSAGFLRRFRDPIRVPRISNRVPRIRENYHRVPKTRENRIPRIRKIGSLQIQTGFLTFSFIKNLTYSNCMSPWDFLFKPVSFGGESVYMGLLIQSDWQP